MAAAWLTEGRPALVVRAVDTTELGPSLMGEVLLVDRNGERAGGLLRGAADPALTAAADRLWHQDGSGLTVESITIPFDEAVAAGLTCGGSVQVLLQRLDLIPAALWEALSANATAVLVTRLDGAQPSALTVRADGTVDGSLGDPGLDRRAVEDATRLVRSPGGGSAALDSDGVPLLLETWNPAPRLVVVGDVALSAALSGLAVQLGWHPTITTGADDSVAAIEQLNPNDLVIVIEHRPERRHPGPHHGPAPSRGLRGCARLPPHPGGPAQRAGQQRGERRRTRHLVRPHRPEPGGPLPLESAISIVAEIIAVRAGRDARPLRVTNSRISG